MVSLQWPGISSMRLKNCCAKKPMKPANSILTSRALASNKGHLANEIIAGVAVIGLLYWAREVIVPIALAMIISMMMLPVVHLLRRVGIGTTSSVFVAVSAIAALMIAGTALLSLQLAHVAASLPQYEETIRSKGTDLKEVTLDRMSAIQGEAGRVIRHLTEQAPVPVTRKTAKQILTASTEPVRVEIQSPPDSPQKLIAQIISSTWEPLQTTGIVLIVLIFVLLDHEALRDRFIRLIGTQDLRSTTAAINDVRDRLSRYFACQLGLNFGVGLIIWIGMIIIGFPHAALWAALTILFRFIPYLGILTAAASATLLAAAVAPGWSLALLTVGLYIVTETIVAQFIEPKIYGHSTGVSPLSVVIGAIFWSWLWGPVGLIVSTPLTLCLAVAGHHVKSLRFLDILLGDAPALTMAQNFYQRSLSGDADEIISAARIFLKRSTFAAYSDAVITRALHLASLDFKEGNINDELQKKVSNTLVSVLEALDFGSGKRIHKKMPGDVIDHTNLTHHLRHQREEATGRRRIPTSTSLNPIVMGIGAGPVGNSLATELLIRILRDIGVDAEHVSFEELRSISNRIVDPSPALIIYFVSLAGDEEHRISSELVAQVRGWYPKAAIRAVLLPGVLTSQISNQSDDNFDLVTHSFEQVVQHTKNSNSNKVLSENV